MPLSYTPRLRNTQGNSNQQDKNSALAVSQHHIAVPLGIQHKLLIPCLGCMFPLRTAEGLCLHFWCSSCRLDKNHLIVFWLEMHTSRLSTLLFCKRIRLRSCRRLLSSCLKPHVHRNTCCFHKVCTMWKLLMKCLVSKFQAGN